MTKKLRIGDPVREKDGDEKIGVVVHVMRDNDVVVVMFPPRQEGYAFHRDDLERV
jgi:hypothetical protein